MLKVEAGIVGMLDGSLPVPTRLEYDALNDPYAVSVTFIPPLEAPILWVFGRDLLIEGLKLPVGEGSVKIKPDFNHVWLLVTTQKGSANFRFQRTDIQDFVNRMTSLVPRNTEHEFVNWDEELKLFEE